jgi:hypothetical protein
MKRRDYLTGLSLLLTLLSFIFSACDSGGIASTDSNFNKDGSVNFDGGHGGDWYIDAGTGGCISNDQCDGGFACNTSTGVCKPAPLIELDSTSLDFGLVAPGTSRTLRVLLHNRGNAVLTVSGAAFSQGTNPEGGPVLFVATPSRKLPFMVYKDYAGAVDVTYTPDKPVSRSGKLIVTSDDPRNPLLMVPLDTGCSKCVPDLAIVEPVATPPTVLYPIKGTAGPFMLDIGEVATGATKKLTITVMNYVPADVILTVESIAVTPKSANAFAASFNDRQNPPSKLTPPIYLEGWQMVDLTVEYSPSVQADVDETDLAIKTNDPDVDGDGTPDDGVLQVVLFGKSK